MARTPKERLFIKDRALKAAYEAGGDVVEEVDLYLEDAETAVPTEPAWDRRDEAVTLLAWHYYQVGERRKAKQAAGTTATGQVLERKLDNGSTKFADVDKRHGPGEHGTTEPGAAFDALIETRWTGLPEIC